MSEDDMSIDPIEYGKLTQQVKHLADAQEENNQILREHRVLMGDDRAAIQELTNAVRELSARLTPLENSLFMRPTKHWKAAAIFIVLVAMLAVKGIAGTIDYAWKALMP